MEFEVIIRSYLRRTTGLDRFYYFDQTGFLVEITWINLLRHPGLEVQGLQH
jgi:hypothetical protein